MEIDKAIRDCDDRRLKIKYKNAIYVIQRALQLYSIEEVAFSFNGGKDSTVLLHLLRAGYFLHQAEHGHSNNEGLSDGRFTFPIRTIYFETPSVFPEINSFTYETAASYGVQLDIIWEDFKSGLEALLKAKPTRAIFLGVRIGDPTAVGQEQFSRMARFHESESDIGLVIQGCMGFPFDVHGSVLRSLRSRFCRHYNFSGLRSYTSIGSTNDTVPNALLSINDSTVSKQKFRPAYMLSDGRLERAGRSRKLRPVATSNGLKCAELEPHQGCILTASIVAVGDEILFGTIEDRLGPLLCRKLHLIDWVISKIATVRSEVDSVAEEVERLKSMSDLVFIYGGVGPLHSDVTVGGVAKAFGVRLAPDEEYEENLSHLYGDKCTGDRNEMAQLPEGITELRQHEQLRVPLIKCRNVIVLSATNVDELDRQWDALIDLRSTNLLASSGSFVSKHLTTSLSDLEVAQPLSKNAIEFPNIYTGCYRKSRAGPLVITLEGKDRETVDAAMEALSKKLSSGVKRISA